MLASEAGMSRTAFALHFKSQVGWSPIDYVLRWRMRLAARMLSTGRIPLAELAHNVGYDSETAFGVAFKRVMGCTPRQYGRRSQPST
jgi:AraC-like DNA-binding protein